MSAHHDAAALLAALTETFVSEDGMGASRRATADLADAAWPLMRDREPALADAE